jgi:hypothetical protein
LLIPPKAITCSSRCRSLIPLDADHLFRPKPIAPAPSDARRVSGLLCCSF